MNDARAKAREAVHVVGRRLLPSNSELDYWDEAICDQVTGAIISAYEAALEAAGFVLVPKEANVAMFRALTANWQHKDRASLWALGSFAEDYRAMIAAASPHANQPQQSEQNHKGEDA